MSKLYKCNFCSSTVYDVELSLKQAGDRMFLHAYGDCPSCEKHRFRKSSHVMIPMNQEAVDYITAMKKEIYNKVEEVK